MLRKALHLFSAAGMLVRECATIFGDTRWLASTIRGLFMRGLPEERSSKVKVSMERAEQTPGPVVLAFLIFCRYEVSFRSSLACLFAFFVSALASACGSKL